MWSRGFLGVAVNFLQFFWFIILTVNIYRHLHLGLATWFLGLVQNWNGGHLVQNLLRIQESNSRTLNQAQSPSVWGTSGPTQVTGQWSRPCLHYPQTLWKSLGFLLGDWPVHRPWWENGPLGISCSFYTWNSDWNICPYLMLSFAWWVPIYYWNFCADILKSNPVL